MKRISERWIIFLVGAVQFINILDFMMVMPLGPDFAKALGIPEAHLGYVGGAYALSAGSAGLLGAFFLDRFDRRPALTVAMLGLAVGTAVGGLATGIWSLLLARFIAGFFGGPATSLALAIIADVIPPERRGRAMGAVMGAMSVASVLGVPAGLWLAQVGSWRLPFFGIAGLGLVITVLAASQLPSLRIHLASGLKPPAFGHLFAQPLVRLSYLMTATTMAAGFILIPNISAYIQYNLGYPRDTLGVLYLVGGVVSFGTMRLVGWLVDRHGSFRIGSIGSAMLLIILYLGFVHYVPSVPVMAIFVGFMMSMSFRNVAYNTLTSKVPAPAERARFMSIQSSVQHAASAIGAFVSGQMLVTRADHGLDGIPRVATVSMLLTALLPVMLWLVERGVRARSRRDAAAQEPAERVRA
jgi:predicted MFS family arabinose efflux permease